MSIEFGFGFSARTDQQAFGTSTYSNELSINEICVTENMWRDRIFKSKFITLYLVFHNIFPHDILRKIASNEEYRAIEVNKRKQCDVEYCHEYLLLLTPRPNL
jgi:hypothetical protein